MDKDSLDDNNNPIYKQPLNPFFDPDNYENVGKTVLISILDIFEKNPYTRVPNTL